MEIKTEVLLEGLEDYFEVGQYKAVLTEFEQAQGFAKVQVAVKLFPLAVVAMENVYKDAYDMAEGGGKEKREALIDWIDESVELPFLLEKLGLDRKISGMAIDMIVEQLNTEKGQEWFDKVGDLLDLGDTA